MQVTGLFQDEEGERWASVVWYYRASETALSYVAHVMAALDPHRLWRATAEDNATYEVDVGQLRTILGR